MKNILIANSKGGSGKTTLATNLAGYFASLGGRVMLTDLDRQQSSAQWLQRRPAEMPIIHSYNPRSKAHTMEPDWIITDSPAGFRDEKLADAVKQADCVIVPIQPSAFDMGATSDFLDRLVEEKAIRKNKTFVALVGMRVNSRTHAAAGLAEFMEQTGFPVLTYLRNAQVYATAAELGVSLFDMRPSVVAQDVEQWVPLLDWVVEATSDGS
ncbi:MAG: cobyrinic acid a,c-diamide synthase [Betaproteobacteria bacterium HGW-Betaproteobacteria-20]|jgi:chromosome partitioning protein|nr:MAG: cobyrinic acid a,c-diamide synthase [Betaproteobacteria bacterium HGW-Betaproteobacteria-20]